MHREEEYHAFHMQLNLQEQIKCMDFMAPNRLYRLFNSMYIPKMNLGETTHPNLEWNGKTRFQICLS